MSAAESEARFRTMADSAPLFIWLGGKDANTYYVNKTWTDFLGMSQDDAIAYGMAESMHPDDRALAASTYRAAFEKREPYTIECRFRRVDGEIRWILSKGAPLFLPDGSLTGYIGTSVDITDRRETENQLHTTLQRERLLRRIVEITSQSFDIQLILKTVADELGAYFEADRASVNRYAMDNDEFIYDMSAEYCRTGIGAIEPADANLIMNAFRQLTPEALTEWHEQIVNITNQQQYLSYLKQEFDAFPYDLPGLTWERLQEIVIKYGVRSSLRVNIHYRGKPYGNISLSQCTHNRYWTATEVELLKTVAEYMGSAIYQAELYRKAQETAIQEQRTREARERYARKLEISNRELEQFATIASHDLQEPLRKVQFFTSMLAEKVGEDGQESIARIQNATFRMQNLIEDLLTLSRVTRKGKPFNKTNLNHCVRDVMDALDFMIQEAHAHFIVSELMTIDADALQICQLFQNLFTNAIKFRRPDRPVKIEVTGDVITDTLYRITIKDNGIGFKDTYKERIFTPFERVHGKFKFPGTGIGLAICRKIVERHNGTITAQGLIDQGAVFTIILPMNQ